MAHLEGLDKRTISSANWALKLVDGTLIPCHGELLAIVSPVLAGLQDTKPVKGSKYMVEVPFAKGADVAEAFLLWVYHRPNEWTDSQAIELAQLSRIWDIQCGFSDFSRFY